MFSEARSYSGDYGDSPGPDAPCSPQPTRLIDVNRRDALAEGAAKVRAVTRMFDAIAPRYDVLNRVLSFRLDVRWRRQAVEQLALARGSLVLDLACGTGDLCKELERQGHVAIGVDMSSGMLAAARSRARLIRADVLRLPARARSVDGVTCGLAMRNFEAIEPFLFAAAGAIRPGGRMALLEVSAPNSLLLRWGHRVYFNRVVPAVGGLFSDRDAYRYLPDSVAYLLPTSTMIELLHRAGFVDIEYHQLSLGIAQLYIATRQTAGRVSRRDPRELPPL